MTIIDKIYSQDEDINFPTSVLTQGRDTKFEVKVHYSSKLPKFSVDHPYYLPNVVEERTINDMQSIEVSDEILLTFRSRLESAKKNQETFTVVIESSDLSESDSNLWSKNSLYFALSD